MIRVIAIILGVTTLFACKPRTESLIASDATRKPLFHTEQKLFDHLNPVCKPWTLNRFINQNNYFFDTVKVEDEAMFDDKLYSIMKTELWQNASVVERKRQRYGEGFAALPRFVTLPVTGPDGRKFNIKVKLSYQDILRAPTIVRNFIAQNMANFYQDLPVRIIKRDFGFVTGVNLFHNPRDDQPKPPAQPVTDNPNAEGDGNESTAEVSSDAEVNEGEGEAGNGDAPSMAEVEMAPVTSALPEELDNTEGCDENCQVLTNAVAAPESGNRPPEQQRAKLAFGDVIKVNYADLKQPLYTINAVQEKSRTGDYSQEVIKDELNSRDVFLVIYNGEYLASGFGIWLGDKVSLATADVNDILVFGEIVEESVGPLVNLYKQIAVPTTKPEGIKEAKVSGEAIVDMGRKVDLLDVKDGKDAIYRLERSTLDMNISFTQSYGLGKDPLTMGGGCNCRPAITGNKRIPAEFEFANYIPKLTKFVGSFREARDTVKAFGDKVKKDYKTMTNRDIKRFQGVDAVYFKGSKRAEYEAIKAADPEMINEIINSVENYLDFNMDKAPKSAVEELEKLEVELRRTVAMLSDLELAHNTTLSHFSYRGHGKDFPSINYEGKSRTLPWVFHAMQEYFWSGSDNVFRTWSLYHRVKYRATQNRYLDVSEYKVGMFSKNYYELDSDLAIWFTDKNRRLILQAMTGERPPSVDPDYSNFYVPKPKIDYSSSTDLGFYPGMPLTGFMLQEGEEEPQMKGKATSVRARENVNYVNREIREYLEKHHKVIFFIMDDMRIDKGSVYIKLSSRIRKEEDDKDKGESRDYRLKRAGPALDRQITQMDAILGRYDDHMKALARVSSAIQGERPRSTPRADDDDEENQENEENTES